ncbi:MAG: hypothetical protein COR54_06405 [Elusimicrobia bacterium CG22_combo_CG10-13_8_21_14_all_63_91]|nr:MAG: hypothetical protein COR54_06405 [Elusimicrobia bacterium CG22_combo_CG10-13_8_21_14_all_63_91]PJA18577.1 MAG: hypothetical protein COX66_00725 [Elusimicrobia bacterium CG_4_10_14_0_2_um_filter_63_34]
MPPRSIFGQFPPQPPRDQPGQYPERLVTHLYVRDLGSVPVSLDIFLPPPLDFPSLSYSFKPLHSAQFPLEVRPIS